MIKNDRQLNRNQGFTLIEIMIALVIVSILVAFGFPSYRDYVIRSNRSDGHSALIEAAALQERYFLDNNSYTASMADLKYETSPEGYYALTAAAGDCGSIALCFKLTAVPQGNQVDDACGSLTLTSTGEKDWTGDPAMDCW
jgi:type IV pilus assembly protein PilE